MAGEERRSTQAPLQGDIGWSYSLAGWVIEVVDPETNKQLTAEVVTMDTLPRMLRPAGGRSLEVRNGLVVTRVGNFGQSTPEVLPALRAALSTHQGRSIVWGHNPRLASRL